MASKEKKVRVSTVEMAERSAMTEKEAPSHVRALYEFHDSIEQVSSVMGRIDEATWLQGRNYTLAEVAAIASREKTGLARAFTIAKARNEGMSPPFVAPVVDYPVLVADDAERYPSWEAAVKAIGRKEASERSLAKYVKAVRDDAKDPKPLSEIAHRILLGIYNTVKKVETQGRPKMLVPPIVNIRDLLMECLAGTVPEASKIMFGPFPTPAEGGEIGDDEAEAEEEQIEVEQTVEV